MRSTKVSSFCLQLAISKNQRLSVVLHTQLRTLNCIYLSMFAHSEERPSLRPSYPHFPGPKTGSKLNVWTSILLTPSIACHLWTILGLISYPKRLLQVWHRSPTAQQRRHPQSRLPSAAKGSLPRGRTAGRTSLRTHRDRAYLAPQTRTWMLVVVFRISTSGSLSQVGRGKPSCI